MSVNKQMAALLGNSVARAIARIDRAQNIREKYPN